MTTNPLLVPALALWIGAAAAILCVLVAAASARCRPVASSSRRRRRPQRRAGADGRRTAAAPTPAPGRATSRSTSSQLAIAGGIFMIPIVGDVDPGGDDGDRAVPWPAQAAACCPTAGRRPRPARRRAGHVRSAKAYRLCQQFPSAAANVDPGDAAQGRPPAAGDRIGRGPGQPARGRQAVFQRPLAQPGGVAFDDARPDRHDPGHDHGLSSADDPRRRAPTARRSWPPASIRPWSRRSPAWPWRFPRRSSSHFFEGRILSVFPPDRRADLQPAAAAGALRRPRRGSAGRPETATAAANDTGSVDRAGSRPAARSRSGVAMAVNQSRERRWACSTSRR